MRSLNHNLTNERDEMKSLNHNLMSQLQNQTDYLNATVSELNKTIDELQKHIETTWCPDYWTTFGKSCYLMSKSLEIWPNSKRDCETRGAHLVIISSLEEQEFISSFNQRVWIGLTEVERENNWKWIDGTAASTTYWVRGEPNNSFEDCVELIGPAPATANWNDLRCGVDLYFICEIMFQ
ncbi:C-type lectin domain family 4 member M-like [Centropristis striata]|uniref:C-type lectin domain family 4 member M-like n=1 Tax=Centropristis striata TaxID=184440 RepID=UPI0027E0AD9E|nr:C-type lectin domain family 4 member M-like [Centropristis striata]